MSNFELPKIGMLKQRAIPEQQSVPTKVSQPDAFPCLEPENPLKTDNSDSSQIIDLINNEYEKTENNVISNLITNYEQEAKILQADEDTTHKINNFIQEIQSQILNDDGSINIDNVRQLFESGAMGAGEFLAALGYDLRTEEGALAAGLTRSDTFQFTLEDGTVISGSLATDWVVNQEGVTPSVTITTPDGQKNEFEYNYSTKGFSNAEDGTHSSDFQESHYIRKPSEPPKPEPSIQPECPPPSDELRTEPPTQPAIAPPPTPSPRFQ